MKKHRLCDFPLRFTCCGLYFPKNIYKKEFGTYWEDGVTCKNCLKNINKEKRRVIYGEISVFKDCL